MRYRPTLSIRQFNDPAIIVFDVECVTSSSVNVPKAEFRRERQRPYKQLFSIVTFVVVRHVGGLDEDGGNILRLSRRARRHALVGARVAAVRR